MASNLHTVCRNAGIWLTAWLLAIGSLSCSDTVFDPFDNGERFFTIYGFLDALETQHAVRVIPVTRTSVDIAAPSSDQASIDALVTSTDLRTGAVTRWNHSLERLADGSFGHIFRARFIVRPGRTYRLEVLRSDSTVTSAETTIPRLPDTEPNPRELPFPYEVSPDSGLSRVIHIPDLPSPWDMIVTYDLQGTFIRLPYGRRGTRTEDGGWDFLIDMGADAPRMRDFLGRTESDALPLLHAILLQVKVLDDNWDPPLGVFDPEVLSQPGVLSNVVNGYGMWGGVGLYQYTWIAPPGS